MVDFLPDNDQKNTIALTVRDAAQHYGVSQSTIRNRLRNGTLVKLEGEGPMKVVVPVNTADNNSSEIPRSEKTSSNFWSKIFFPTLLPFAWILISTVFSYFVAQAGLKDENGRGSLLLSVGVCIAVVALFVTFLWDKKERNWIIYLIILSGILFILFFALTYFGHELKDEALPQNTSQMAAFSDAIYFSVVTATTLGYGDFSPPPHIRLVAALQATVGYVYLAFFVGFVLGKK